MNSLVCCSFLIMVLTNKIVEGHRPPNTFVPCQTNKDCDYLVSAKCENYICICNGTRFCRAKDIVLASPTFVPCENDQECDYLESATCENHACVCNGTQTCKQKNTDVVVTALEAPCSKSKECNIENSECSADSRKCVCKKGYVSASSGKKCLLVSDGIGGTCEENVQCYTKTNNTGCQNNKCVCQQDMHADNGTCYRSLDLGQECRYDGECSDTLFARCNKSRCTCSESFVPSRKLSLCLQIATSNGSLCVEDIQCTTTLGGGAACIGGFCNCKEMYQMKPTTNHCVKDMLLGDMCANHTDCHQPYPGPSRLECILGNCQCRSGYVETDGYCITASASSVKGYINTLLLLVLCLYLLS